MVETFESVVGADCCWWLNSKYSMRAAIKTCHTLLLVCRESPAWDRKVPVTRMRLKVVDPTLTAQPFFENLAGIDLQASTEDSVLDATFNLGGIMSSKTRSGIPSTRGHKLGVNQIMTKHPWCIKFEHCPWISHFPRLWTVMSRLCHQYNASGSCTYGTSCRFMHVDLNDVTSPSLKSHKVCDQPLC
jgi:hypothetical protein